MIPLPSQDKTQSVVKVSPAYLGSSAIQTLIPKSPLCQSLLCSREMEVSLWVRQVVHQYISKQEIKGCICGSGKTTMQTFFKTAAVFPAADSTLRLLGSKGSFVSKPSCFPGQGAHWQLAQSLLQATFIKMEQAESFS